MKKIISIVLAVLILIMSAPLSELSGLYISFFSEKANAISETDSIISGSYGIMDWVIDKEIRTLTIIGSGVMPAINDADDQPWKSYRSYISSVNISDEFTSISSYAFYNCTALESVTIPEGVTSIGDSAFRNCTALESVTIPDGVTSIGSSAFYNCSKITEISIPDSVKGLGSSIFYNCTSLSDVKLPKNITTIPSSAFYNCNSLNTIVIPDSVTRIDYDAFCSSGLTEMTISKNLNYIGGDSFAYTSIKKVNFTNIDQWKGFNYRIQSEEDYWDYYFLRFNKSWEMYCNGIKVTNISIPENANYIPGYAFYNCSSITDVTISENVSTIYNYAFYNCSSLTSMELPENVKDIRAYAFSGCNNLESIIIYNVNCNISNTAIPANVTIYGFDGSTAEEFANKYGLHFVSLNEVHTHTEKVLNSVEATCIKSGLTEGKKCTVCGKTIVAQEIIPAFGHKDLNNDIICDICGVTICDIIPGQTKVVRIEPYTITYLKFIPSATGRYIFNSNGNSNTFGYLFDENKNELYSTYYGGYNNNFKITCELEKGKTYYFGCRYYNSSSSGSFEVELICDEIYCQHLNTVTVEETESNCSEVGFTEGIKCTDCEKYISGHEEKIFKFHADTDNDYVCDVCGKNVSDIDISNKKSINLKTQETKYFRFVPKESGVYSFISNSTNVYVSINDNNGEVISGKSFNNSYYTYRLSLYFEAGEQYLISFENKSGERNFTYSFLLEEPECIHKNTEIIEGVEPTDTTIGYTDGVFCKDCQRCISGCKMLFTELKLKHYEHKQLSFTAPFTALYTINTSNESTGNFDWQIKEKESIEPLGQTRHGNSNNRISHSYNGYLLEKDKEYVIDVNYYTDTSMYKIVLSVKVVPGYNWMYKVDEIPASCSNSGYTEGVKCSICNDALYGITEIPSHHIDENNDRICDECGEAAIIISGNVNSNSEGKFNYILYSNGDLIINGESLKSIKYLVSKTRINYYDYKYDYDYRQMVKRIIISDSVDLNATYLFAYCENLEEVVLPNSLNMIPDYTFLDCKSLKKVIIPNTVEYIGEGAFAGSGIEDINIPEKVDAITYYTFSNCHSLKNVELSEGLREIGTGAFMDCEALEAIDLPTSVEVICEKAFCDTGLINFTIPDSVEKIGNGILSNCKKIESLTIPYIGYSIDNNEGLSYLFFGDYYDWYDEDEKNIKFVPETLKRVEITKATEINYSAFNSCKYITDISIPDTITSIGNDAFKNCDSLKNVYIHDIESWCNINFYNEKSNPLNTAQNLYVNNNLTTDITIPNSIKVLNNYVFAGCLSLKNVELSEGLREIGTGAFMGCEALEAIDLPTSVEKIGKGIMEDCNSIESLTIPYIGSSIDNNKGLSYLFFNAYYDWYDEDEKNIKFVPETLKRVEITKATEINYSAFNSCKYITDISIPDTITSIGNDAFKNCDSLKNVYIQDIESWCNINFYNEKSNPLNTAQNLYVNNNLTTDITIPNSIEVLNNYVFAGFSGLNSVKLSDNITCIGISAFEETGIKDINLVKGIIEIKEDAFNKCYNLETAEISDTVSLIGYNAFNNCNKLAKVNISDLSSWCNIMFDNEKSNPLYYAHNLYIDDELLTELVIPDTTTDINDYAFVNNNNIESVKTTDSVSDIGNNAFSGCISLKNVEIGTGLTGSINVSTFYKCPIEKITIKSNNCTIQDSSQVFPSDAVIYCNHHSTALNYAKTYFRTVSMLDNHTYLVKMIVPVTCSAYGYTYSTCDCGDTNVEYTNPIGHIDTNADNSCDFCKIKLSNSTCDHDYEINIVEATCNDAGVITSTCKLCNKTITKTVDAKGHNFVSFTFEPTCTQDGYTKHYCVNCGDEYVDAVKRATGHSMRTETIQPTCTENGCDIEICSTCAYNYTNNEVKALGHSVVKDYAAPATCTHTGLTEGSHCSVCDTVLVAQKTVAKLNHTQVIDEYVAPTCVTTGLTKGAHCSTCGTVITAQKVIDKTAHSDENNDGVCDECGDKVKNENIKNCSCNCHKSGFMGFIYKIQRFFWKLFGTNKVCKCGVTHY